MTLYPATLLHSLIASMILLIFLDLLSTQSCHPWRQFYLFLLLFIPLPCCHACSEIGGKHSIFHHYDVSWVFFMFIYMPFTRSRKLSSISSMLRVFITNGCLILLFLHLLWWSHKVFLYNTLFYACVNNFCNIPQIFRGVAEEDKSPGSFFKVTTRS